MRGKPSLKEIKESLDYMFKLGYFGLSERTTDFKKTDKEFKHNKRNIIYLFNKFKQIETEQRVKLFKSSDTNERLIKPFKTKQEGLNYLRDL